MTGSASHVNVPTVWSAESTSVKLCRANLFRGRRLILGEGYRRRNVASEQPTHEPGKKREKNAECLVHGRS